MAPPVLSLTWSGMRHTWPPPDPQAPPLEPKLRLPSPLGPQPHGIFTEMPLSRTTQIK